MIARPKWLSFGSNVWPTVKYSERNGPSNATSRITSPSTSCRASATRSKLMTRCSASQTLWKRTSRVRLEMIALLISRRVRARSAAAATCALSAVIASKAFMFSTTSAIWFAASWRKSVSVSSYWLGIVLATARVPMLVPRAMRGTIT